MFFAKLPKQSKQDGTTSYRNVGSGVVQNGGITVTLAEGESGALLLFQGECNRQPVADRYEVLFERNDGSLGPIGSAKAQQNGHGLSCYFNDFTVRGSKRLFLRPVAALAAKTPAGGGASRLPLPLTSTLKVQVKGLRLSAHQESCQTQEGQRPTGPQRSLYDVGQEGNHQE